MDITGLMIYLYLLSLYQRNSDTESYANQRADSEVYRKMVNGKQDLKFVHVFNYQSNSTSDRQSTDSCSANYTPTQDEALAFAG